MIPSIGLWRNWADRRIGMTKQIAVETRNQSELIEISGQVTSIIHESEVDDGYCLVYVPHTTCGITINENADPDVRKDIVAGLNKSVPDLAGYAHLEGNSAAHIKASLMGVSVIIPIVKGELILGTWQGIYLCEFDGPRTRRIIIQVR